MKLLSIVLSVYLWSCHLLATSTYPKVFIPVDYKEYVEKNNTRIEIENMPRIRSQDSFPICYGLSATTIAQKFICDQDKEEYPDCGQIPPGKEISVFSMIAWAKSTNENLDPKSYDNHKNISIGLLSGSDALMNSEKSFSFMPESCYPLDQIANKYSGAKKEDVENMLNELTKKYEDNRTKTEAAASIDTCPECLSNEINEKLGTMVSAKEISEALKKKSSSEFLYSVIFNNCRRTSFHPKPIYNNYPPENVNITDSLQLLPKIKEVLKDKNTPLQIEGVCLIRDSKNECKGKHSFVISGYKEVCKKSNTCKTLFKVQNSWGKDWQNTNNEGWLEAEPILKSINSSPRMNTGILSWLTPH